MDKAIKQVKKIRADWWEVFKDFIKIPGYHYYKGPPELKVRYPAPASGKRTPVDSPNLFKVHYKVPFRDHPFNIRPKPIKVNKMEGSLHFMTGKNKELDPSREVDRNVLLGPIRNRVRNPAVCTFLDDDEFNENWDREEYGKKLREHLATAPKDNRTIAIDDCPALGEGMETTYRPEFFMNFPRGASPIYNDKRIQHMYLEVEYYITEVAGKQRIESQEMDMYKGTVKKWQVLDEQAFTKDQVDKVQSAIKAPSSDELDQFKEESETKMTLPISNSNVSQWRDKRRAIDTADFNAKLIEFEKNRSENFFMKRYERPKELHHE